MCTIIGLLFNMHNIKSTKFKNFDYNENISNILDSHRYFIDSIDFATEKATYNTSLLTIVMKSNISHKTYN